MKFDFAGKTVLVTGGTRGIGRAAAVLFAASGATVIATYRSDAESADALLAELGPGDHAVLPLDVGDADAVEAFFKQYESRYDRLDILVNNAGVFNEHKILETSFADWRRSWHHTLQTNLNGAANMCWFAARIMMRHGGGKIINMSSRGAFRGEPDHPAYGASKAGLNAMSQSLAIALAPHNISVHIIAPGFVETDMTQDVLNGSQGDAIRSQSPFGRVATAGEVARVVAVFASEGMTFTSAGIIDINGASYLRS